MPPISVKPLESDDATRQAAPAADAPQQIQYESAAAPISRRQFRLIFLLTIVNTIMLVLFVAGPGISRMTTGWWNDFKQWRADRAAAEQRAQIRRKFEADYEAGRQYAAPGDRVIYEEDPTRAAKLLAGGSEYARVSTNNYVYLTPQPWQSPVFRKPAELPPPFQSARESVVFLHSRTTSGIERLVRVELSATEDMQMESQSDVERHYYVSNGRILLGQSLNPRPDNSLEGSMGRMLGIVQIPRVATRIDWYIGPDGKWETGRVQSTPHNIMRIFAGQPDPSDASHFTIGYELDGKPGIIDGWLLKDLTVALQPRLGRIISDDGTGRNRIWDPYAVSPATQPMRPPDLPSAPARRDERTDR